MEQYPVARRGTRSGCPQTVRSSSNVPKSFETVDERGRRWDGGDDETGRGIPKDESFEGSFSPMTWNIIISEVLTALVRDL